MRNGPDVIGGHVVLVTSRSFSSGISDVEATLAAWGCAVVRGPSDHDLVGLTPVLATSVAWIAGTAAVTAAHLDAAPYLRIVARYGVGVDAVDLAAAADRGVLVTNTPGANANAVADHALALLLTALRDVMRGDRGVRSGEWSVWRSRELGALTVGVLGFGRIGQAVARRLSGFGCRVLVSDPKVPDAFVYERNAEPVDGARLPELCDVVSLHAPGGQVVVDQAWLRRVTRPLILVNTARADLVDELALAAAMRSGAQVTYATDVLAHEYGVQASPLLDGDLTDRVIVTPHVAAQTVEAIDAMGSMAVENVLAVLSGGHPPNQVALHRSSP